MPLDVLNVLPWRSRRVQLEVFDEQHNNSSLSSLPPASETEVTLMFRCPYQLHADYRFSIRPWQSRQSSSPGVAVADYVSTSFLQHLFENSSINVSQWNRPRWKWPASGHVIKFGVVSATRCSCYMQCLGCEWIITLGLQPVVKPSSNWGGYLLFLRPTQ